MGGSHARSNEVHWHETKKVLTIAAQAMKFTGIVQK